jgi:hypothetical protein
VNVTDGNMTATLPTRSFSFILDPACLSFEELMPIFSLIREMKEICSELGIEIVIPSYMVTQEDLSLFTIFNINLNVINRPPNLINIELDESIDEDIVKKFTNNTESSDRALALLSLSESLKSDGIITNNVLLIEARYPIYQYHGIRIIPLGKFSDIIDIIAHGNSIFSSASSTLRNLTFDVFYQFTHYKNRRFFSWFNKIIRELDNIELINNVRSALLNRYPYILYSRDMIRFYELQRDYYLRRGERRFHLMLGYYLSNYYMLLWGMLDHLTVIAKYAYNLSIKERYCGINSDKFWGKFKSKEPNLYKFMKISPSPISEWIDIMAEMRHHAAHKVIKIPTRILEETDESKMSDADILEIIRNETNDTELMYQLLPEDYIKKVHEPILVNEWRLGKMKEIAPSMVIIKMENRIVFRDPALSVDYDLERLNAVIDAFIIIMFRKMMKIPTR